VLATTCPGASFVSAPALSNSKVLMTIKSSEIKPITLSGE